jgi:hypothetical protein
MKAPSGSRSRGFDEQQAAYHFGVSTRMLQFRLNVTAARARVARADRCVRSRRSTA